LNDRFNEVLAFFNLIATRHSYGVDEDKWTIMVALMGGPPIPGGTPPGTNSTAGTWNYVYPLESKKATYTDPLKTEKNKLIKKIKDALNDVYSDIPDSKIDIALTSATGLTAKANRAAGTEPEFIEELVIIGLVSPGGGDMKVICRKEAMSSRGSKFNKRCDIEFAYSIVAAGDTPPASAKDCKITALATKATSILELGSDAVGKTLYLYARWVYTKYPKKSGKFGTAVNKVIG
jgi:hypothetical protein